MKAGLDWENQRLGTNYKSVVIVHGGDEVDWEKGSDTANTVAGSVPRDISVTLCHTDCALISSFVICEKE